MYKHEVIFELSDVERLVVSGEHIDEQCCCCCDTPLSFCSNDICYGLETVNVKSCMAVFAEQLTKALENKLRLDKTIKQDIARLWNIEEYYFHNGLGHVPEFKYEMTQGFSKPQWVGYKNAILSAMPSNALGTWLYNDDEGNIIFEIAPIYPWFSYDPKTEPVPEGFIPFEEFMKNYKPTLIRKIPVEVARKWAEQAKQASQDIYDLLARESEEYEKKLAAEEKQ